VGTPDQRGDKSMRLHRLQMATFRLAGQFNPPSYQDARMSVYAYLVVSAAGVLLIDTGIGTGNARIDARFEPQRTPIEGELARFGVRISDVTRIVNSHLHFDHCGNNSRFASAEIFVQAAELAVARELGDRYTVTRWFDYDDARLTAVHGDAQIAPGITLLSTPGHTPGHQSVLLESGGVRLLVAAQAAFTAAEYRRGGDAELQAHTGLSDAYVGSLTRLRGIGADEIYFSHDNQSVT
jgi:N-acyl homoserine lactone hydrolase